MISRHLNYSSQQISAPSFNICFGANGEKLYGIGNNNLEIWYLKTKERQMSKDRTQGLMSLLAPLPNKNELVIWDRSSISFWSLDGQLKKELVGGGIVSLYIPRAMCLFMNLSKNVG